jgi:hypothetical protein
MIIKEISAGCAFEVFALDVKKTGLALQYAELPRVHS